MTNSFDPKTGEAILEVRDGRGTDSGKYAITAYNKNGFADVSADVTIISSEGKPLKKGLKPGLSIDDDEVFTESDQGSATPKKPEDEPEKEKKERKRGKKITKEMRAKTSSLTEIEIEGEKVEGSIEDIPAMIKTVKSKTETKVLEAKVKGKGQLPPEFLVLTRAVMVQTGETIRLLYKVKGQTFITCMMIVQCQVACVGRRSRGLNNYTYNNQ